VRTMRGQWCCLCRSQGQRLSHASDWNDQVRLCTYSSCESTDSQMKPKVRYK
jgi:hypothetical protein